MPWNRQRRLKAKGPSPSMRISRDALRMLSNTDSTRAPPRLYVYEGDCRRQTPGLRTITEGVYRQDPPREPPGWRRSSLMKRVCLRIALRPCSHIPLSEERCALGKAGIRDPLSPHDQPDDRTRPRPILVAEATDIRSEGNVRDVARQVTGPRRSIRAVPCGPPRQSEDQVTDTRSVRINLTP